MKVRCRIQKVQSVPGLLASIVDEAIGGFKDCKHLCPLIIILVSFAFIWFY